MKRACVSCFYFNRAKMKTYGTDIGEHPYGECRYNPPKGGEATVGGIIPGSHPIVSIAHWCGKWKQLNDQGDLL